MWDLSSQARDQTHVPCIGRWILNHWPTREVPWQLIFIKILCACMLSQIWLFVTPHSIAHQAPLTVGFSQCGYWSGLPFPPLGIFPTRDWTCISCILADRLPLSHLGIHLLRYKTLWHACWISPVSVFIFQKVKVLVAQLCPTLWDLVASFFCLWDSPGKNTGLGSYSLLQGIFLAQELNLHWTSCIVGRFFTVWATREANSSSHLSGIWTVSLLMNF